MDGHHAVRHAAHPNRRRMLIGSGLALAGLAAATPLALAALPENGPAGRAAPDGPMRFDEVYRGRRIQGWTEPVAHHGPGGGEHHRSGGHGHDRHGGGARVLVDGRDLHLMRNADGSWISVVNHYQTYDDLRALARGAVDALDGAALIPLA
ncbi:Tyrosinase cofactor [Streptomyces albus]|uniref:Tyrosinase cofactor n=1 Tax=Streptomyces albus (strain ATCC 21838 / DSM 41398 / FERM P-419 / JCM 4703 / NBRC 107858) TaxID=1081613 RepID=A0A0B5F5A9_STRA4|nr:Tyrosinase cofactor [Streptomyces albus]AOU80372.1 Tyrosinase cofactor [Streptomyces albus]